MLGEILGSGLKGAFLNKWKVKPRFKKQNM